MAYEYFGHYNMMGGNYIFSWLFGILGIIVLILLIIYLMRKIDETSNKKHRRKK